MQYVPEHTSVLANEAVSLWHACRGGLYIDATLGLAGHACKLLELDSSAKLIGLDQDEEALLVAKEKLKNFSGRVELHHSNFRDLQRWCGADVLADGILADLGVSSLQLDKKNRGFSFRSQEKLDMRMDASAGETADAFIARATIPELAKVLRVYGEERWALAIAKALKALVRDNRLTGETAAESIAIIYRKMQRKSSEKIHPATRTFQALRIAVNDELSALEKFLRSVPECLTPGGRIVVITFHSLEDRIVKNAFRSWALGCVCPDDFPVCRCQKKSTFKILTKKAILPSEEECKNNPRARSAKLRAAEKI